MVSSTHLTASNALELLDVTCLVSESELTTKKDLENAYNILNPASSRISMLSLS